MTGKGYRCPQQRAEYLEGKEPRRASHHGSHLSKEATFINPAVILSYGGILPGDEITKSEKQKKKDEGDDGKLPRPPPPGHHQPRIAFLAHEIGASSSHNEDRQR